MTIALSLKQLYAAIEAPLDAARHTVAREWTDAFRLVYGPDATPPRLGGKMLRPALCFLSSGVVGAENPAKFADMAAAMELLHLAALAHDDVVDRADTRRGTTSLNRLWDNHTAVLGGDYLVARALDILTRYESTAVIRSALHSIHQMAEGELINFGRKQKQLEEEDCIRLAEKKTASLFAVSSSCAAVLLDSPHERALYDFGMGVGTGFQLADDLLDLDQDEETLGKPSCGDLIEGKMTLPILYLREAMQAIEVARLDAFVGNAMTAEDRAWVRRKLGETGAREKTELLAREFVNRGKAALEAIPASSESEAMLGIAEFVLLRDA
jgi:geranylgeranyl pyrophosphate synthase